MKGNINGGVGAGLIGRPYKSQARCGPQPNSLITLL